MYFQVQKVVPASTTLSSVNSVSGKGQAADSEVISNLRVLANVAYSYDVIRTCARTVRDRPYYDDKGSRIDSKWKHDKRTRDLKFSDKWIWGALRRKLLHRRRVTTVLKPEPSEEEVQSRMREIQSAIDCEGLDEDEVANSDETGIHWAQSLLYQYVPKDAARAEAPEGDESGRFTALLGSVASGAMLPLFLILRVNCKDHRDLSASRVLQNYYREGGLCDPAKGWVMGTYEREHPDKGMFSFQNLLFI
jgi:hypothetical protein